ncbi:MAG: hypothetical protein QXF26_00755 [Candidatus Bathyarchaeia archaeon]
MSEVAEELLGKIMDMIRDHERRISELERILSENKAVKIEPVKEAEDIVQRVLSSSLETDRYSFLHKLSGLPLFLSILDLVSNEFNVDALSPSEISSILSGKFGIRAERSNISHTLSSAITGGYVDRIKSARGSGYVYRITKKGLEYLRNALPISADTNESKLQTS